MTSDEIFEKLLDTDWLVETLSNAYIDGIRTPLSQAIKLQTILGIRGIRQPDITGLEEALWIIKRNDGKIITHFDGRGTSLSCHCNNCAEDAVQFIRANWKKEL